jgi:hypothetical protein
MLDTKLLLDLLQKCGEHKDSNLMQSPYVPGLHPKAEFYLLSLPCLQDFNGLDQAG